MKLSINFVKEYIDLEEDVKQIAEDMTKAGNEYDDASSLLANTKLTIGKVLECKMHPDSDHLHVCKVDVGKEVLNIVCGAPNVREGLKVIVALDGAELPDKIIKRGIIRGEESNGMLCSMSELGLEHKFLEEVDKIGIHELPEDAPIGENPIKYMELDDEVIDFDLTANRGDLLSVLGMAYELGAIYDRKVKPMEVSYTENAEDLSKSFEVKVNTENCKIFLAKKVKNVQIKESPAYIKARLIASGIRPINNVVDISNYVMLETGQPLHFYDADKLPNGVIETRMAKQGEVVKTLDGIERTLTDEDIVISDGKRAIGLAGVMGGYDTEITENTKNILIEAAIFDPIKVRKTAKALIRSEASNRFEKGLDPNRTYLAVERACHLLEKLAGAEIVGNMAIYDETEKDDKKIDITFENINRILGMDIPKEAVVDVFRKLDFKCELEGNDLEKQEKVTVLVPRRRVDISIKEDLIEEVGRIYGVDNIVGKLPSVPIKPGSYDKTTRQIRNKMVDLGLNETLSYILVNDKEAKMGTKDDTELVMLLDPMTEERNTLRHSIIPSLYKIYEYNKARYNYDVSIFEIGKAFYKKGEEYGEENCLACLMTGNYQKGIGKNEKIDFYVIKGVAEEVLEYLGFAGRYRLKVDPENMSDAFHPGQSAIINVNGTDVGVIGRIHPAICKEAVYVMEINLEKLLQIKVGKMKYKEISKYPSVKKDLAIVVENTLTSLEIETQIKKSGGSSLKEITVFDLYTGKGIEEGKKSLAYSLTFSKEDRTLTDEEVNASLEKIIKDLENKCKAELRK